jgi:hypothetical protein
MSRPIGVTASAIVAIVGSLLALVFSAFAIASLFVATTQPTPPNAAQAVIGGAAMIAALGAIGIWTSIGLFKLRPWARASMLVFAGFLAAASLFFLLITAILPLPPEAMALTDQTFRRTASVVMGVPLAIAVWWLIQFNTPSTKAAFASQGDAGISTRPVSITFIAWMTIVGAVSCVFPLLTHAPVFLFGAVFTGWISPVFYLFFALLSLYVGKGLLDLNERARLVAIALSAFGLVHTIVVTLVPTVRQKMLEVQRALEQKQPHPLPFDQGVFTNIIFGCVAVVAAGSIWFLVRNRAAFNASSPQPDTV